MFSNKTSLSRDVCLANFYTDLAKVYLVKQQKIKENDLGKNTSIEKLINLAFHAFFGCAPALKLINGEIRTFEISFEYTGWLKQFVNNVSKDEEMIENITTVQYVAENLLKGVLQFGNVNSETQSRFDSHKISILVKLNQLQNQ